MTEELSPAELAEMVPLLASVRSGRVRITMGGAPLAAVEAEPHTIRIDVRPFVSEWHRFLSSARDARGGLHGAHGLPRALAEAGWQVVLYRGPTEIARIGRGTSALLGHVHLDLAALGLLRDLF